jgi:O-methyltransferase
MPASAPSAPHPGLTSARAARATGPRPDAEGLRRAYLELLKLTLCDLAGTTTTSVGRMEREGAIASRELEGEGRRLRAAGMDWPLHGLTMVGLNRLDDLQECVESVVRDGVPGDLIEAGTWRGGAAMLMRATLDSLGAGERTLYVADSFRGFPASGDEEWAAMAFLQVPLDEVRANFDRFGLDHGVQFVEGFFEDTMPAVPAEARWSLVRLDGDTYDATRVTLEHLYPALSPGGYLVVDDYGSIEDCRRAVDEYRAQHGIAEPIEEVDWTCVRWRRESDAPIERPRGTAGRPASPQPAPARSRVPTLEERGLEDELAALRARLAAVEAELEAFRASPVKGLREWGRQRLGR